MKNNLNENRERGEFDGYIMEMKPNTPENRKKAAEAREAAVLYAKELSKKYNFKL